MPDPGTLLLAGYLVSLMGLNLIGALISSFYQRKFKEPSPKAGFIAAVVMLAAVTVALFVPAPQGPWAETLGGLLLGGSAAASAWNSVSLFFTMKRIRK